MNWPGAAGTNASRAPDASAEPEGPSSVTRRFSHRTTPRRRSRALFQTIVRSQVRKAASPRKLPRRSRAVIHAGWPLSGRPATTARADASPSGRGSFVHLESVWDTEEEAEEFRLALEDWLPRRFPDAVKSGTSEQGATYAKDDQISFAQRRGAKVRLVLGIPREVASRLGP